jgi:signal peptidase I
MTTAKWGFRLAVSLGCLSLFLLWINPLVSLLHSALCFAFALGIRKHRAWAAIAAAGFWLLPVPVLLLRGAPPNAIPALALSAAIGAAMLWTALALWHDRASRLHPWPWVAVLLLFTLGFVSLQPFRQPSSSMSPTVLAGDYFLVDTASWKLGRTPQRNQIVAFHYPLDPQQIFIKRIVAVPGDRVAMHDKQLIVNGVPVREPWAVHTSTYIDPYRDSLRGEELVVPRDSYFVLGDDRDDSLDSRYFGFVQRSKIVGSPLFIYGSYNLPAPAHQIPSVLNMRWDRLLKRL